MAVKRFLAFGSLLGAITLPYPVLSAAPASYSVMISKYKQDAGQTRCLRTNSNNNTVSIGDCSAKGGATDYGSMRLWTAVKQSDGYYLLKNKYKKDANKGECLRTLSGVSEPVVGDCTAKGGATDYTSMRLWKFVDSGDYVLLQNKYKQDAGQPNCMRTFNNGNTVLLGQCNAQGGASDYTSMRQWISGAFPSAKAWGPTGIISVPYSLPDVPPSGFDRLSFPIKIVDSPEKAGFFYAMQYRFINGNLGYIGLQPRGVNTGLAIFSVFGSGVKAVDANCTGSADGGEGSSCSKTVNLILGHKYNLTVKRDDNGLVWRGYVEDITTRVMTEIGAWQPRGGSEGLNNSEVGYVEYFPQINACSEIPSTDVFFGDPVADSATTGTLQKPFSYGKCKELIGFSVSENAGGWDITLKGK